MADWLNSIQTQKKSLLPASTNQGGADWLDSVSGGASVYRPNRLVSEIVEPLPEPKKTFIKKADEFKEKTNQFLFGDQLISPVEERKKGLFEKIGEGFKNFVKKLETPEEKRKPSPKNLSDVYDILTLPTLEKGKKEYQIRADEIKKKETLTNKDKKLLSNYEKTIAEIERIEKIPGLERIKEQKKINIVSQARTAQDISAGFASTTAGLLKSVRWVESNIREVDPNKKRLTNLIYSGGSKIQGWSDAVSVKEPDFSDEFIQSIGSSAPFYVIGFGSGKVISAINTISPKIAMLFGGAISAFMESGFEAGDVYETNIKNDKTTKEAKNRANKTFILNAVWNTLTNRLGLFDPNSKGILKTVLASFSGESLQEAFQQIVSNVNTDRDPAEGVPESAVFGGLFGGFAGGANVITETSLERGEYTPQEVLDQVIGSPIEKTEEGKALIKSALEAKAQGNNITIDKEKANKGGPTDIYNQATEKVVESKKIAHAGKSTLEEVKRRGVIGAENGIFGKGVYFADPNSSSIKEFGTQEEGTIYQIDKNKFDFITLDSKAKEENFIKEQGLSTESRNLVEALQKNNQYDGAIITNPDPQIGNTYIISNLEKLNKVIRGEEVKPEVEKPVVLDSLKQAKASGMSFDEWVKGQGEAVYHGTDKSFDSFDVSKSGTSFNLSEGGLFFVKEKETAEAFSSLLKGDKKRVVEAYVKPKNPKIVDLKDSVFYPVENNKIIADAKKQGHDVLIFKNIKSGKNYKTDYTVVLDNNAVKTRSQLKAEWDSIQSQPKVSSLKQAKASGMSFDEWVKGQANFVHETNTPNIKEFDMSKIGSGEGEAWLGRGIYSQEKGSFKIEKYGKYEVDVALSPNAKIFKIEDTPNGKWRDNFVEWFNKKEPRFESSLEEWQYPKNVLPRDLLMNKGKGDKIIDDLLKEGYDGILQDGELVIFNPKSIKTRSQLKAEWDKLGNKTDDITTSIKQAESRNLLEEDPQKKFDKEGKEKTPEIKKGKGAIFDRVFEQLKLESNVEDNFVSIALRDQAKKAVSYMEANPQDAIKVSLRQMVPPKGITFEAINIATSKQALANNQMQLYTDLVASRSVMVSRSAQSLGIERLVNSLSTDTFVQEVFRDRVRKLATSKGFRDRFRSVLKKGGKISLGLDILSNATDLARKKIDRTVKSKIASAQSIIDSLTC